MSNIVGFRLRVGKDDDLEVALNSLPKHLEKGDIIREALRSYFFNAPTPLRSSLTQNQVTVQPQITTNNHPKQIPPIPSFVAPVLDVAKEDDKIDDIFNKSLGL